MRWIYSSVCFHAALLLAQAQTDNRASGNIRDRDAKDAASVAGAASATERLANPTEKVKSTNDDAFKTPDIFGLDQQSSSQRQARPNQFVIDTPEGPGIHAGFQARGPNYAASMTGGVKTTNQGTVQKGLNLAGSFGDTNERLPRNTQQREFGAQSRGFDAQGTRSPIQDEGATFAVAYKPGLLTALGDIFNPFRLIQQIGDAVAGGVAGLGQGMAGLTQGISQGVAGLGQGIGQGLGQGLGMGQGMGQASASFQAQSQYIPPQAQRSRNSNGVGVTWRPLYQAVPSMANNW